MPDLSQKLFKKIVLHNKLVPEDVVDGLLAETPDPEQAVQQLIDRQLLTVEMGEKLLKLFHDKMAKLTLPGHTSPVRATPPAGGELADAEAAAREPEPPTEEPFPVSADQGSRELVHHFLMKAREAGASDLHIKSEMAAVVRSAGVLRDLPGPALSPDVCEQSLLAILNDEQRREFLESHDLDLCYDAGDQLGRFRTNIMREHRGVGAVFRPIASKVPDFDELNLPETVKKFTDFRVGIVLVTGPKGCGKTTTLAAMIDHINDNRPEHIITIEDPIEFVHPCKSGHVNQRQVGPHTKSFGNALRSALREAPDVIMVGEMRDLETTSLAITAAETGHLVFGTLHTPDAIRTIGRVLDVFPPKEQAQIRAMVSESLRAIISQLLVPSCTGDSMELAVEILVNTPAIGHLIREHRVHQIRGLMQTGKKQGMVLMDESLVHLAKEGKISKEDALARAEETTYVEQELGAGPNIGE